MLRRFLQAIFLAVFVTSCANTALPEIEAGDVPERYSGPVASSEVVWPELDWWRSFESDELIQIMRVVETVNLDLASNLRNIEQANIILRGAGFDLYPTPVIDAGVGSRYSGSDDATGSYDSNTNTDFSLGASIAYTDILSKPDRYDLAVARYDADMARFAELRLNTFGQVASTYFQVLLIRDRIRAAEQNLENALAVERIVQARANVGTVTALDALQQQIEVQRQRTNVQRLVQDELAALSSLATLHATSVTDFEVVTSSLEPLVVPEVFAGLPSTLLNRRPDIVAAEADLRQFRANVDIARLALYPTVSLTAGAGLLNPSLGQIFEGNDFSANGLANVLQTLLDNGARKRNLRISELDLETALANYRKTIISAFNEIETSLSNIALLESLEQVAAEDLARAEEAYRIASVRYREGVAQYQTVLTTQNTLFSVRNSYLDNKLARLNAVIDFYQSLGGGWERSN